MSLSLIAAVAKNNAIGIKNKLPWNIPEDLKRFKELTMGKTVLMGQKTYESLIEKLKSPLSGRKSVVVSQDRNFKAAKNVVVYDDLQKALQDYKDTDLFVIGGASIYQQTINFADTLYITHVKKEVDGDAFFPAIDSGIFQKESEEDHGDFSFAVYRKKTSL